jgi:ribonuclease P protein subunit POP4
MKKEKQSFIGLETTVIDSTNQTLIGLKGKIVDETKNSFKIKTSKGLKIVLKNTSSFEINHQKIIGQKINKTPQERIKDKK